MTLSLNDQHRRLNDLEAAFTSLVQALQDAGGPQARDAVTNAAARLRARGRTGAADLLLGDLAEAAYRRT